MKLYTAMPPAISRGGILLELHRFVSLLQCMYEPYGSLVIYKSEELDKYSFNVVYHRQTQRGTQYIKICKVLYREQVAPGKNSECMFVVENLYKDKASEFKELYIDWCKNIFSTNRIYDTRCDYHFVVEGG